jgi:hypothetical protein
MASHDAERILVREDLLELAGERLFEQVSQCRKRLPLADIAGFIEGDGKRASRIVAGPRNAIADIVRKRFPKSRQVEQLAALVHLRDHGNLTCAFVVRLGDGSIDVSVMSLAMNREDEEGDVPEPPPPPPPPPLSPEQQAQIAAYVRERDEVLRDPDLDRLRNHLAKWGKPDALKASDEVMRAAWHKARSGVTSLTREERRKSVKWLEERGMSHSAGRDLEEMS